MSEEIPADPYDPRGLRHRVMACYIFHPGSGTLLPWPADIGADEEQFYPFFQGDGVNPEFPDRERRITAAPAHIVGNSIVRQLAIHQCLSMKAAFPGAHWSQPHLVTAHLVAQRPKPGKTSPVSPNYLHQDLEDTAIHLIERIGVTGGQSVIGKVAAAGLHPSEASPNHILYKCTLRPGETLYIRDSMVSHHANAVSVDPDYDGKDGPARRCTILMDAKPFNLEPYYA
ncbi:2OG-Fe dioxygenase family protein [Nisaea sp.]|uniref:2OG-Fe dioxygenase family protein n=1 Tax=Nisaea sp. TaxID=2024842 RepID=UPI002B2782FA|nr:2OG-Fe dioxygenase family protein [Nisaea sp.]